MAIRVRDESGGRRSRSGSIPFRYMDDIQIRRVLGVGSPSELGLPVNERAAVEGGEEPFVRVENERVSLLDAVVFVAYRSSKDLGAAVRAVNMEPPIPLLRDLAYSSKIVDDPTVGRS